MTFAPGEYRFDEGINLNNVRNVRFVGTPGTVFVFRPMDEFGRIRALADHAWGEKALTVDHPELVKVGATYQVFKPDLVGNRILECTVGGIQGNRLALSWMNVTSESMKMVPKGSYLIPQLNFFNGRVCGDMSFTDIVFDGRAAIGKIELNGRSFHGHTTHSGLLFRNVYQPGTPRPASRNIRLVGCTFRNLLGRGAVFYNIEGVTVRDCTFESIKTEGLEIDHWSREGVISGCRFRNCKTGLQLNDCSEVITTGCHFTDCKTAIKVLNYLKDPTTNRSLVIQANVIKNANRGLIIPPGAENNLIIGNSFVDAGDVAVILKGDRNVFSSNSISGSRLAGVQLEGLGCRLAGNLFIRPEGAAKFVAVLR